MSAQHNDALDPQPLTLQSLLFGVCIGLVMIAVPQILVRLTQNTAHGVLTAIWSAVTLAPVLVILIVTRYVQSSTKTRRYRRSLVLAGLVIGLIPGVLVYGMVKSEQQLTREFIEANRPLIEQRLSQLASVREQLDDFPRGSVSERITAEQITALKTTPFNLDFSKYDLPAEWDTLVTEESDYVHIKPGFQFGAGKAFEGRYGRHTAWDRELLDRQFKLEWQFNTGWRPRVDEYAGLMWDTTLLIREDIEHMVAEIEQLRYVVIVRMTDLNDAQLVGKQFLPGYYEGEVFCFDLENEKLIGAFPFATTNSKSVMTWNTEGASDAAKESGAVNSLEDDLKKNVFLAFWHQMHDIGESIASNRNVEPLPYDELALGEAKLIWQQSITAEKE